MLNKLNPNNAINFGPEANLDGWPLGTKLRSWVQNLEGFELILWQVETKGCLRSSDPIKHRVSRNKKLSRLKKTFGHFFKLSYSLSSSVEINQFITLESDYWNKESQLEVDEERERERSAGTCLTVSCRGRDVITATPWYVNELTDGIINKS